MTSSTRLATEDDGPNTTNFPPALHFAFFSPNAVARTLNASNMSSAAT